MNKKNVDFQELFRKQTWIERATVLYRRSEVCHTLATVDALTDCKGIL